MLGILQRVYQLHCPHFLLTLFRRCINPGFQFARCHCKAHFVLVTATDTLPVLPLVIAEHDDAIHGRAFWAYGPGDKTFDDTHGILP